MNLLALDLSLTSTGWAARYGGEPVTWGTVTPLGVGVGRLADAVGQVHRLVTVLSPDLVILEGYSFASRNSRAHALGELGGVVRLELFRRGVPFVELAPKIRAKLATGLGNAAKEHVLVEAVRRLGYLGHSNDEADALWLLQAGLIAYRLEGAVKVPAKHMEAMKGIDWPVFPGLARAS